MAAVSLWVNTLPRYAGNGNEYDRGIRSPKPARNNVVLERGVPAAYKEKPGLLSVRPV
jgi:hypothetical protein